VYTPAERTGKAYKFACPYKGPYRVLQLYDSGVQVKLVSKPNSESIGVALNRIHLCPAEIVNAEGNESNETVEHDQLLRNGTEVLQNQTNSYYECGSPEGEDSWPRRLRPRAKK